MLKCFEETNYPVNDDALGDSNFQQTTGKFKTFCDHVYCFLDKISAHFRLFKPCSSNRHEFIDAALRYQV
jgi:hypothetical protein